MPTESADVVRADLRTDLGVVDDTAGVRVSAEVLYQGVSPVSGRWMRGGMREPFDLGRFVEAQDPVIDQVRQELATGRKRGHWMWFVFPQMVGLGRSALAQRYAIASREEAAAYRRHPILGPRLVDCTRLVNRVDGRSIGEIFAAPDDLKFHSSMTLFAAVPGAPPVFAEALKKYFRGARDRLTLDRLAQDDADA